MFSASGKLLATKSAAATGDPHWAQVVALIPMDGVNNGTVFTDLKGHAITATGAPTTITTKPLFGRASGSFNGSQYLQMADSNDWDFGTNDMCIEFWFNTTSGATAMTAVNRGWGGSPYTGGASFQVNGAGGPPTGPTIFMADHSTSAPLLVSSVTTYRDGNWHFLKWSKSGGSHSLWLDNTQIAITTSAAAFGISAQPMTIATDATFGGRGMVGQLANVRITNGAARLDEGLPTGPFPTF